MKTMKGIAQVLVIFLFFGFLYGIVSPFWQKRGLDKILTTTAVYGTKHTIEDTMKFLDRSLKKKGYPFSSADFEIDKDENKTVTIHIKYTDDIKVFGKALKEIEFTVEETAYEVKEVW